MPDTCTLTVDNVKAHLDGPEEAKAIAVRLLSYRPSGYQFVRAYKTKRWDGWKCLYNRHTDTFPAGLVSNLGSVLETSGYPVTVVEDCFRFPDDPAVAAAKIKVTLEPHQREAVTRILQQRRGVVQHPVGAGKSIIIVGAALATKQRSLVLVQRKELLSQQYQQFVKHTTKGAALVGVVGSGTWREAPVIVATVQTLLRAIKDVKRIRQVHELLASIGAVFIDECHHLPADTYSTLLAAMPNAYYRIGLSATAFRGGDREQELFVTGLTGPVISEYTPSEGVELGRLVNADVFMVEGLTVPRIPGGAFNLDNTYGKEVERAIIDNERRNEAIVDVVGQLSKLGPTMALIERLDHGANLRAMLLDAGHEEVK